MLVIVISFLSLHSLRIILNIDEMVTYEDRENTLKKANEKGEMCRGDQFWHAMAINYCHLLLVLNASINFFVYGFFGKQFRDVTKEKMRNLRNFICSCEKERRDRQNDTEMPVISHEC